ncbi:MAG TPA: MFS transporter [Polyangiaceae bacterium]|nr:MFS transporter [Polyangiaceae bacterium]
MSSEKAGERRRIWSWALYDWANSAFATTVMAGFFPTFFDKYWSAGVDAETSTFRLGVANSLASLIIVVCAPILGAIADAGRLRKALLFGFMLLGSGTTGALFFVGRGDWLAAAALFVLGSVGFMAANVFYDALLVDVAPPERRDSVSALGYAMGYLGGGLLFALQVGWVLAPGRFGFADASGAVRVSFPTVAIWWLTFSLPLLLFVREPERPPAPRGAIRGGIAELGATLRQARQLRVVFTFLLAYWLYIDGVDTVIRMAVKYGLSLGFADTALITALLITQFVGFPAALAFGYFGNRFGTKASLLVAIGVYIAVTIGAVFMTEERHFYVLAVVVGLVQGGVQALSRSLYSCIIPADKSSEFFGLYNMLGKFAAVIGPVLVGAAALVAGSRLSILAILVLFVSGGALLVRVDVDEGRRRAAALRDAQGREA